jgi:hypothetical protein
VPIAQMKPTSSRANAVLTLTGTVESIFGNIQNKGMRRFTLRGQKKVSAQWKLFTMVHNIEKVAGVARR